MATQTYMTAKLNLADGTIVYPQVSLDNIVASISDPTLVSVATKGSNGKVPVGQLPITATVTASETTVPTAGAVYTALGTKQATLTAGPGITLTGSTIMATVVNLNDMVISQEPTNGVSLNVSLDGNTVSAVVALVGATAGVPGTVAGVGDGIELSDGVISADTGDGLKISSGEIAIDEASVESTLQDVRIDEGSTVSPVDDQVVTPGNLRGALSVGQAVDVSCQAARTSSFCPPTYNPDFLSPFTLTGAAGGASKQIVFGFYTGALFPKRAPGLKYLFIADVCNTGSALNTISSHGQSIMLVGVGNGIKTIPGITTTAPADKSYTEYTRVAMVFGGDDNTLCYLIWNMPAANPTAVEISIQNWRQYEVTALTDEAIAYIASLPDPDQFFRSTTIFQVRDKYLVKQDMVCPWIYTIGMPDNSDLTVGAGLSYKIRYTNDNPHKITVDTIPTDAYGWDARIQMFIKGTSSIVFQKPLILMDALTPNAGHNLLVKFRNGDAYVYVEDTNAGYIVTEPSGTGAGTLNFGIVDPNTDYVIFAPALDGTTVDAGTAAFVGGSTITTLNILGNGMDATTITGDISAASGMTINLQSLTIDGGITFGGAGTINLDDVCINDPITNSSTNLAIQAVDVSANNNTVVITGGIITAASGAQVIPYGETEPVAVVAGTGNKFLNNGRLGYLVSDPAATTDANTLYDALVGGGTPYSNVIFDPELNGQTVSYTFSASATLPTNRTIWGNGAGNTIIGGKLVFNYANYLYVKDVTISCPIQAKGWIRNCVFTGGSTGNMQSNALYYFRAATYTFDAEITDCVFRDTNAGANYLVSGNERAVATFTRCLFTGNTDGVSIQWPGSTTYPSYITLTGCTFTNNTHVAGALRGGYFLNSTITDCVFDTGEHIIIHGGSISFAGTNIIDSAVSGAGYVVFTDGATVTSTIPSGSTIGTGIISALNHSQTNNNPLGSDILIENVTITGCTSVGPIFKAGSTTANTIIRNCVITGNTLSVGTGGDMQSRVVLASAASNEQAGIIYLKKVTITNNTGDNWATNNGIYAYTNGVIFMDDCTYGGLVSAYNGVLVLGGTNFANGGIGLPSTTASGKIIFKPNSVSEVPSSSMEAKGTSMFYVGTYDEATGAVTTTGTATAVLNGTTVSISGSGTTIDSTGLHS